LKLKTLAAKTLTTVIKPTGGVFVITGQQVPTKYHRMRRRYIENVRRILASGETGRTFRSLAVNRTNC